MHKTAYGIMISLYSIGLAGILSLQYFTAHSVILILFIGLGTSLAFLTSSAYHVFNVSDEITLRRLYGAGLTSASMRIWVSMAISFLLALVLFLIFLDIAGAGVFHELSLLRDVTANIHIICLSLTIVFLNIAIVPWIVYRYVPLV